MKRMRMIVKWTLAVAASLMLAGGEGWAQQSPSPSVSASHHIADSYNRQSAIGNPQSEGPQSAIRNPQSANPQSTVIDRLVAVVNEEPITESDRLWFLALDAEVPAGSFSDELKRIALEQLIDQQLLYQEAQKLPSIEVSQDEINKYISELITRFPSESAFRRRLEAVGLDQTRLQEIVQRRLLILQFIEFRFRAFVFVSDQEIQSYYERRVLPLAQERGETPPPLDQVKELIEKDIIEDKVASESSLWFEEARRRSEIVRLVEYED